MKRKIIITESQYRRIFKESSLSDLGNAVGDLGADTVSAIINTIPVVDWAVAGSSIVKNLKEIKSETAELNKSVDLGSSEEEINDIQNELLEDIVDLVQRILEISPDPGITEFVSFLSSVEYNLSRKLLNKKIIDFIGKREKIIDFLKRNEKNPILTGILPKDINPTNILIDAFDALKKSTQQISGLTDNNQLKSDIDRKKWNELNDYLSS